ncbi:MAG: hypothetical protein EBY11_15690, partial [Proteobacteria bacterium]|nr:hypothetical protein [Pseudomonadota bacterium]
MLGRFIFMEDQQHKIAKPTTLANTLRQDSSRRRLGALTLSALAVAPGRALAEGSRDVAVTSVDPARETALPWVPRYPSDRLAEEVVSVLRGRDELVSIAAVHLLDGTGVALNADDVVPPASLFKLNILAETYRQIERNRVKLAQMITILPEDAAPGA